jgi:hypothetical protein
VARRRESNAVVKAFGRSAKAIRQRYSRHARIDRKFRSQISENKKTRTAFAIRAFELLTLA